jgi:hypothetical protein
MLRLWLKIKALHFHYQDTGYTSKWVRYIKKNGNVISSMDVNTRRLDAEYFHLLKIYSLNQPGFRRVELDWPEY